MKTKKEDPKKAAQNVANDIKKILDELTDVTDTINNNAENFADVGSLMHLRDQIFQAYVSMNLKKDAWECDVRKELAEHLDLKTVL